MWRCISRLDHGTKFCKDSLTVNETDLHQAIVRVLNRFNSEDEATYLTLMRTTIGEAIGLNGGSDEIDMIQRMIDAQNKKMMDLVNQSVKNGVDIEDYEDEFKQISEQIAQLEQRITAIRESETDTHEYEHRLQTIQTTISNRAAHCDEYDDTIVRQMVECIKVYKDGRIEVIFGGGYTIEDYLNGANI